MTLIVAIALVVIVIIFQIRSFWENKTRIKELENIFKDIEGLELIKTSITSAILQSKDSLHEFLIDIPPRGTEMEEEEEEVIEEGLTPLTLIKFSKPKPNEQLSSIIYRTNEYLCKNAGTSAELKILEDICDNQLNILEDEIHSSMNVPLYLGLAGTFLGIIVGLKGINLDSVIKGSLTGIQLLLNGVAIAMVASFLGLIFTTINSTVLYKKAVSTLDKGRGSYMSFLRRELLPLLSSSMAASLNSLRGVLGHFVDKFGHNLDAYADSAELLNDNLEKQHLVLQEINKLSLTQAANKIAESFLQLKDASDSLRDFHRYQEDLNATIINVSETVSQMKTLLNNFKSFTAGLSIVIDNQNTANDLQKKFQEAIENHFPLGGEARDMWRKEYDFLMSEGKKVSESLSTQLTASTEHIRNFVNSNKEFFDTFNGIKEVLSSMNEYTDVQAKCYKDLKDEIQNLRKDYKDAQLESLTLNKLTHEAVDTLTETIEKMKK